MNSDTTLIDGSNGIPLGIFSAGTGETVVFVHGTGADGNRWQAVSEPLSNHFHTVSYDRRGRGSSQDESAYSLEQEMLDLLCVLDSCGSGRPVNVVAHSYGAMIALAAARQRPSVFSRLVLYEAPLAFADTDPFVEIDRLTALEQVYTTTGAAAATEYFLEHFPRIPRQEIDQIKQTSSWATRCKSAVTLARELRAALDFSLSPQEIATVPVPTLLLLGGDSIPAFHASARVLDQHLPDSQLEILPGDTHRAMDSSPGKLVELLAHFFGKPEIINGN